jgi:hypothetical protein
MSRFGGTHSIEFRHQARFSPGSVVPMDDTFASHAVEHADSVSDGGCGGLLFTCPNGNLGLLDKRPCGGTIRPIALPAALGYADPFPR